MTRATAFAGVATRPAAAADAVDGARPSLVVEPATVAEAQAALRQSAADRLAVLPRGGGSKLGLGSPPAAGDLVLSTARLDDVAEHAAGDLVVTAGAGMRLDALQAALRGAGQHLALDPPEEGATLGGVLATAASGPRRLRYGTPRDLVIGVTVVLADGTCARAGGKVVKNVAGYDLAKLLCGSLGTLGVLVEATFRLHPLPEAAATVTAPVATPADAAAGTRELLRSPVVPSAVELDWPDPARPGTLAVLVEGVGPGVRAQAAVTASLLAAGATATPEVASGVPDGFGAPPWAAPGEWPLGVKAACRPSRLPGVLDALWAAAGACGLELRATAHAATAVVRAALRPVAGAGEGALAGFVTGARDRLAGHGATLVVVRAPLAVKEEVDVWGPVGDALGLMRRVKARFDPDWRLNPGRFVGGI